MKGILHLILPSKKRQVAVACDASSSPLLRAGMPSTWCSQRPVVVVALMFVLSFLRISLPRHLLPHEALDHVSHLGDCSYEVFHLNPLSAPLMRRVPSERAQLVVDRIRWRPLKPRSKCIFFKSSTCDGTIQGVESKAAGFPGAFRTSEFGK
jgi:hypothetical protein